MSRKKFPYFFLTTLCALSLEANPLEPTVTAGHAACTASDQKLEVNAHDKTIISWKDFSIGQNETTRFNLPGKDAVILNRVGSSIPSKIEGLLSSNGIVYLINPNGILITATGTIDTAGFLASTLNITDQDFLNGGDLLFKGSGSVTHLGAIKCHGGDVVLMASQVKNEGTIEGGRILLGGGEEIVMTLSGDEKFMVRNTGSLESLKTELKADGNVYAYAIQNEGNIQATATAERAGRIYLVAEKGHVTSSGILTAPGGEVRVLGQTTSLTDAAKIDVSGDAGGGTILIGGDFQGKNPDIPNALVTYAGPDVVLSANSLQSGSGGKVIAWADGETTFYGKVYALGGPLGGDGGFTEISGKNNLDFRGNVYLTAPLGKTGTLLLDPTNITFSTTDSGWTASTPTCTTGYVLSGTPANIQIGAIGSAGTLLDNLHNCSVSIVTTGAGAAAGTITVSNAIDWVDTTTNTLTVTSLSTLTFNAAVTNNTTAGTMIWNSGTTVAINAAITNGPTSGGPSGAGTISITSSGQMIQGSGAPITNNTTTGTISLITTGVTGSIQFNTSITNSGIFNVNSGQDIEFFNNGSYTQTGVGSGTFVSSPVGAGSSFQASSLTTITTSGTGDLSITASNTSNTTAITIDGVLTLNSTGSFTARAPTGLIELDCEVQSNPASAAIFEIEQLDPNGGFITLVGGPYNFATGSMVTLNSANGFITMEGAMTFGPAAGAFLQVTAGDNMNIDCTLNYFSPQPCLFQSVSAMAAGAVPLFFNAGCGDVTFTATGAGVSSISFSAAGMTTFYPGAGSCTVTTSPGGGFITTGPFIFNSGGGNTATFNSASYLTINGDFTYEGGAALDLCQMTAVANLTINDPITFDTSKLSMTADAGFLLNPAGSIMFNPGTDSLAIQGEYVDIEGPISYSGSGPSVSITATGAPISGILITAPISVTTSVPLSLTTPMDYEVSIYSKVLNTSSSPGGTITVNTGTPGNTGILRVGQPSSTLPCQLGSINGDIILKTGFVIVTAGSSTGAYAQIGYNQGPVNSNITATGCFSIQVYPGIADNTYALIGHGSPTNTGMGAGTLNGHISFATPGASLATGQIGADEGQNSGPNSFAQIGHTRSTSVPITATGDITVNIPTSINIYGGNNSNTYAMIGHGGAVGSNGDSYSGSVQVTSQNNIYIETQPANTLNSFAAIGHTAYITGGTTTISAPTVSVTTPALITMSSDLNNECIIGSYVKATGGGTATIDVTNINVTATPYGGLIMNGGSTPGTSVSCSLIGALAYTGTVGPITAPFVAAGTASSTVNVNVSSLLMQTGFGGANTDTFTLIQNGFNGSALPTNITVGGQAILAGGNNFCSITSSGALAFNGTGPLTLLADQTAGSHGTASLLGNGTTTVTGGSISLSGTPNGPEAFITTTTGGLTVQASGNLTLSSNAHILQPGSGYLTVNALAGDFIMENSATIQNSGSGSTIMLVGGMASLLAGQGSVSITHGTGPFTMNVGDNLNLLTNNGGSAFITSNGPVTITAQNIRLSGLGTGQQSLISTTLGDMLLIAQNSITLADNSLIENTGPGAVTLVVDEQAPVAPQVGNGRFILYPDATVSTASGLLHIFTARPNSILAGNLAFGELNGNFVTEGFPCPFGDPTPSSENQYTTYFLAYTSEFGAAALATPSYTIFYKIPFPVPTPPTPPLNHLQHELAKLIWASSEMFYFLRQFDQYDSFESDTVFCYETCHNNNRCTHRLQTYPIIYQNWTLYPVEFEKGSGCPNQKPE